MTNLLLISRRKKKLIDKTSWNSLKKKNTKKLFKRCLKKDLLLDNFNSQG